MASTDPLILLPPSEGKTPGGEGSSWGSGTMAVDLDSRRSQVAAALNRAMRASASDRQKLLGVKGDALAAATAADRSVLESPTLAAIERYSGVLYGALEPWTLGAPTRRRLDRCVLVFSGLWGLVAPSDPIPDYKLKMGASLPGLGKLSTWWRPAIDEALGLRLAGRRRVVWNLLPKEHDAAWSGIPDDSQHRVVSVRFLEPGRDGALVAVSHWNKFLKGALVRFLLENPGAGIEGLADWRHPAGFVLDPSRTVVSGARTGLDLVRAD